MFTVAVVREAAGRAAPGLPPEQGDAGDAPANPPDTAAR